MVLLLPEPLREVYWNIPQEVLPFFYVGAAVSALMFSLGVLNRVSVWVQGQDDERSELSGRGWSGLLVLSLTKLFVQDCMFAKRIFSRSVLRGVMLILIIWSTLALFAGTVLVFLDHYLHLNFFLRGNVYLVFSLVLDVAGLAFLIFIVFALFRRYVIRPERMILSLEDGAILILLLLIGVGGFAVEGLRLAVLRPENMDWSPVGYAFAQAFSSFYGGNLEGLKRAHAMAWITHAIISFTFIAYLPFSKMFHLFASQITTSVAAQRYKYGGR